jgi:hypothetical protein
MAKSIPMQRFLQALFGDRKIAAQAAEIGRAILAARSLRRTEVAAKMKGKAEAAYKRIQRFLRRVDPRPVLRRLFREEAEFVLLDPTEVERPQARKTEYVGVLQDSKTRGFWLLLLATPHRGRAIPCGLVCYSSKTIADRGDSRNQNHMRAIETLKDIVGDRPVGMDREFSYLGFLQYLEAAQVSFVIRLNQGTHPKFQDSEGREPAGPESGLSGCGVQGGGAGPCHRPLGAGSRRTPVGDEQPGTGGGPADVPPTDEDRCDLSGPEGPAGLGTPDESVAGVHGKDGGFAFADLHHRAPRGGESEGFPVRAAAFGVEGTRRVSRPAGASRPRFSSSGSPGHPFPGARESSGPAPAKPVGTEMEALLRSVRTPHAEVVRDASAVAGHRPGGFGFLPGYPLSSCPNSCPNLRRSPLTRDSDGL